MDNTLPKQCYGVNLATGLVIAIKRGEQGFYALEEPPFADEDTINTLNARMGVSVAQRKAMEFGSVFGWDIPGAYAQTWENR